MVDPVRRDGVTFVTDFPNAVTANFEWYSYGKTVTCVTSVTVSRSERGSRGTSATVARACTSDRPPARARGRHLT